jgi:hypothetical protein
MGRKRPLAGKVGGDVPDRLDVSDGRNFVIRIG